MPGQDTGLLGALIDMGSRASVTSGYYGRARWMALGCRGRTALARRCVSAADFRWLIRKTETASRGGAVVDLRRRRCGNLHVGTAMEPEGRLW